PSSGYSLHKDIFVPMKPTLSQIYRTLNDMSTEGLVESDRVEQKKLPARNVFHITESGYDELRQWIRAKSELAQIREPLLQILWFGSVVDKEDILSKVRAYIEEKKGELQYYEAEATKSGRKVKKTQASTLDVFYQNLVFDYIRRRSKVELEWAEVAAQLILEFGLGANKKNARRKASDKDRDKNKD
ncbi:MAG: PadR family transcriptional regulator, partial [Chloroflexi bacterium]|nr:PadR family transcriptional regulator [Chloroflexota bacterium]